MAKPKWLADIESYVDSIPYGNINIPQIEKVNRRVTVVTTVGVETLRYDDNQEAVKDILNFVVSLVDDKHTGDVEFKIEYKEGNISLLAIKNTRKTTY